jgi:hypothetical protein
MTVAPSIPPTNTCKIESPRDRMSCQKLAVYSPAKIPTVKGLTMKQGRINPGFIHATFIHTFPTFPPHPHSAPTLFRFHTHTTAGFLSYQKILISLPGWPVSKSTVVGAGSLLFFFSCGQFSLLLP